MKNSLVTLLPWFLAHHIPSDDHENHLENQENFKVHWIKSKIAVVLDEHFVSSPFVNVHNVGSHSSCTIMVLFVVGWGPEWPAKFDMTNMQLWHSPPIAVSFGVIVPIILLRECERDVTQWVLLSVDLSGTWSQCAHLPPLFSLYTGLLWSFHRVTHSNQPIGQFHTATFLK